MTFRRGFLVMVLAVILVSLIQGPAFSSDDITLTLWTKKQSSKYLTDLRAWGIQEFEKAHPNVKVNHTPMPFKDLVRKCIVSLRAGKAADVMTIPNEFCDLARGGYLLPLDKYIARDVEDWMDFLPHLRDFDTRGGHIYGVPIDYATRVVFYNKDMFADKELLVPPRTWTEFREFAQKLTDPAKGVYGAGIDGKGFMVTGLLNSFVHQAGGSFYNEDWTRSVVNSPEGVEALTWWADLLHKYKVLPPETPDLDFHELIGMFAGGKIGMLHAFYNMYPAIDQTNPHLNYGIAVMPSYRRTWVFSPDWNFCINKKTEHPDEAYALVDMLTSTELQKKLKGYLPTRKSAMKELPLTLKTSLFFGRNGATPPGFSKFPTIYNNSVQKVLLKKCTPKEALDQAAAEINAILQEKASKHDRMKDTGWCPETWKRP